MESEYENKGLRQVEVSSDEEDAIETPIFRADIVHQGVDC